MRINYKWEETRMNRYLYHFMSFKQNGKSKEKDVGIMKELSPIFKC